MPPVHDYDIANQSGANFRADLNNCLDAIVSNNSSSSEPSTKFAYMLWVDTTNNLIKLRNSANNAWITLPLSTTADNTVDINGGAIDGTAIGANAASTGAFTTLSASSALTANAGVVVDNITIDGQEIDVSSGDLTIDVAGDITLDAGGGDWAFNDDGTTIGTFANVNSGDFRIRSHVTNKDIFFMGLDGASNVTALTLDMSDAGTATFNNNLIVGGTAIQNSFSSSQDKTISIQGTRPVLELYESDTAEKGFFALNNSAVVLGGNSNTTSLQFQVDATERMRINSSGDVLINGTQEYNSLNGRGNLVVGSGSGNEGITIVTGTSNSGGITFADGTSGDAAYRGQLEYSHSADAMTFNTAAAERMRIDSSGTLLVDRTSKPNAGEKVAVSREGIAIARGTSSGEYRLIYGNDSSTMVLYFTSGSNQAQLSAAGAWVDASDVAYKKDIVDINYGLDTVKKLKPRTYKMQPDDEQQIGFVAQELELNIPEIVNGEDGSKGVAYGQLTAVLTKAIQEQQKLIEDLQTQINKL